LGLGDVITDFKNNPNGWGHVPPGCSMWGSKVHYNYKLASTRSCDYSHSKYCICSGGLQISTLAVIEPTKTTLGTDAQQRKTALAALQRADASDLAYVVLANGKKCSSAKAITTWNECKIAKDYLKVEDEELNCDVRWSNGSPAWTTCVKVAPYKTHCKWVANVGCKKKILNYHGLYSKPAIGKCEDTGGEVITSLAACQTAAKNLGLGRVEVGNSKGWSHVPPGCSMWSSVVHYNYRLTSTRSCDYSSSKYCICRTILQSWTFRDMKKSHTEYQNGCSLYGQSHLLFNSNTPFNGGPTNLKHRAVCRKK